MKRIRSGPDGPVSSEQLHAALAARKFGRLFPLRNKHQPRIKGWPERATQDPEQVGKWWRKWPDDEIGLLTGEGLLVLDEDRPGALVELEQDLGFELPQTREAQSASRGWHLTYSVPAGLEIHSTSKLWPGIDVKGWHGYVVLPSPRSPGRRWIDEDEPAPAPQELLDRLQRGAHERRNGTGASTLAELLRNPAAHPGRNDWLTAVAGHYAKHIPYFDAYEEQVWIAAGLCEPPLDDDDPESPDEVTNLINSIWGAEHGKRTDYHFLSYYEFAGREFPIAETLLGEPGKVLLAKGSLFMVYGLEGSGKSTWTLDGLVYLAAGVDWLGIKVPRPVRVCIIENEGPPSLFQQKLWTKVEKWRGPDPRPNLFVYARPWGDFSFADQNARLALAQFCDEHEIDLVSANPTLGLGVGASGKPDETNEFVEWMVECGLKSTRAFWPIHHENKAGQISGDWGRHPDTKVLLQQAGPRQTKVTWAKTRWASLEEQEKEVLLAWRGTQSYQVLEERDYAEEIAELLDDGIWWTVKEISALLHASEKKVKEALAGDKRFEVKRGDEVGRNPNAMVWGLL